MSKPRCGLCDVEIPEKTWDTHVKSELHQSKLPKINFVKLPEPVVSEIPDAEKKQNKREGKLAKATNLGYFSQSNGRSGNFVRCECGQTLFVYRWRGQRRCPNCWKVISTHLGLSFWETTGKE